MKTPSIVLAMICVSLMACPKKEDATTGLVKECTEIGQRCLHSPNKMGVCNESHDAERCATPPCLVCSSQH